MFKSLMMTFIYLPIIWLIWSAMEPFNLKNDSKPILTTSESHGICLEHVYVWRYWISEKLIGTRGMHFKIFMHNSKFKYACIRANWGSRCANAINISSLTSIMITFTVSVRQQKSWEFPSDLEQERKLCKYLLTHYLGTNLFHFLPAHCV